MRRAAILVSAAAVVLFAAGLSAQGKPNFSGKWAVDAEKTTAANPAPAGGGGGRGGGRGGPAGPITLTVDATSLTRATEGQNGPQSTTYKLDGTPQTVQMGQTEAKVSAKWDGNTIVLETTRDMQGTSVTTKQVYSMEGDWLVIAQTQPGRNGGEPTTRKTYYKKAM